MIRGVSASTTRDNDHYHLLTKTNIQMCQDCHRFFVITYERNEKGEFVETGLELDIRVTRAGVVKPETEPKESALAPETMRRRSSQSSRDETCW
jgi:hypothetical protein